MLAARERVQRRHLITERFTRRGRRRYHHVAARFGLGQRRRLVTVGCHVQAVQERLVATAVFRPHTQRPPRLKAEKGDLAPVARLRAEPAVI